MTGHAARKRPNRRAEVARIGEDLAAEYVIGLGWTVLDRNWRNRYGELDLIAADDRRLVVVEVKTRASRTFADPATAVTPDKLQRIRRLTRMWLAQQSGHWSQIRFDIIAIKLDPSLPAATERAEVRHHVNIVA
ncbi:MAG: YraN family protein [Gordonia sp. (in: high G+C Gram-positive bacteria)]